MIIKKFTGKTEEEALETAKKELGNQLVVMNIKQVKKKGLFAGFRAKNVEVTVALEEEKDIAATRAGAPIKPKVTPELSAGIVSRTIPLGNPGMGVSSSPKKESPATDEESVQSGHIVTSSNSIEKKLDSLQTLLESRLVKASEDKENSDSKEIEQEHKEAPQGDQLDAQDNVLTGNPEQEKFLKLLYNTMIDNEVDEKYVNQILDEIVKSVKPNMPIDYILANVYQKMILKFGKPGNSDASKVQVFLGPTGVGKTTTIAKIASIYSVNRNERIALLTTDTFRIAAAEQLRTYASILEVPFKIIYTAEELKKAIEDFKDYDHILVDTAGHSHQNEEQMEKIKELLDAVREIPEKQPFLVMSATTKYKDLLKIADQYSEFTDYQLIFTKLDETSTYGNILNMKLKTNAAVAYVTCGQNVPNDIEVFDPQKTVKQILGSKTWH